MKYNLKYKNMKYKEIKKIKSNILDVKTNEIYLAEVVVEKGYFKEVNHLTTDSNGVCELDFDGIMVPGFIDAHIHIESSLLTPSNFAKAVVPYGTTSVIADPHEIANVSGIEGVDFMIEDASQVPFDFYFSAPSSVPATKFETSGACLDCGAIEELLKKDEVVALGEVMNFLGVINRDEEIICKLNVAKRYNKPIDGHAPMLSGEDLEKYVNISKSNVKSNIKNDVINDVVCDVVSNLDNESENIVNTKSISTDHECVSFDEAIEKKKLGMKIMVREGSSAKNMEALFNIRDRIALSSNQDFFGSVSVADFETVLKNPIFDFLVSDDKDPNDLKEGHLNILIKKAIGFGIDPIEAIKMVTINPANHYNLDSGVIEVGKKANFVFIDNFDDFNIKNTFFSGKIVAENGKSLIEADKSVFKDTFNLTKKFPDDFQVIVDDSFDSSINGSNSNTNNNTNKNINNNNNINNNSYKNINKNNNINNIINNDNDDNNNLFLNVRAIEVIDGEIITDSIEVCLNIKDNIIQEDIDRDILKLAVVERYGNNNIANGFIKGFNLKKGAIASSVAHDSHNIIVIGTNAKDMARAVNLIHENKGGLAVVFDNEEELLKLPIAGLMSDKDVFTVSNKLEKINNIVRELGCSLESPFMTLSFMALLVIPELRLSDKGLFDVDKFSFVDLIIE